MDRPRCGVHISTGTEVRSTGTTDENQNFGCVPGGGINGDQNDGRTEIVCQHQLDNQSNKHNMMPPVNQNWPFVVNLGNSIIGVALLAMPFCFKQCGILLGMLVLLFCTWLTLASCQLLVKAGIVSHHRSYEFLAYHTYGAPGKFLVEIGMIGMQLGTLVAQIVVIGDLGPPIVSHVLGAENSPRTRTYLIVVLCLFVGLPLGLMKDLRNVSRASTICITFYVGFTVYVLSRSAGNLLNAEWYSHVNFWRPQGLFQCLPILSFSFGCQTQLFILYDALPDPSLHAIKSIIHSAVNLCAVAYLVVGFFGYVTFYELQDIPGDIITVFPLNFSTILIKLGFVMSIAITFPVIIYPCRSSIYTLLFQKKSKHSEDGTSGYIPEVLFKGITVAIVVGSMITGILIPNVEFILGLNGAITGTLICYIFPALFFLRVMSNKAEGKTIAQMVLVFGVSILLVSTFTVLYAQDKGHVHDDVQQLVQKAADQMDIPDHQLAPSVKSANQGIESNDDQGRRVEPPNPDGPGPDEKAGLQADKPKPAEDDAKVKEGGDKAEDTGAKKQEERQEILLQALESQRVEQEKLLNEQKALLKELKDHKEQVHPSNDQDAAQQGDGNQPDQGLKQAPLQPQVQNQGQAPIQDQGLKQEPLQAQVLVQNQGFNQGQLQGQVQQQGQGLKQDPLKGQVQQQGQGLQQDPLQGQVQQQGQGLQQDPLQGQVQQQQQGQGQLNPIQLQQAAQNLPPAQGAQQNGLLQQQQPPQGALQQANQQQGDINNLGNVPKIIQAKHVPNVALNQPAIQDNQQQPDGKLAAGGQVVNNESQNKQAVDNQPQQVKPDALDSAPQQAPHNPVIGQQGPAAIGNLPSDSNKQQNFVQGAAAVDSNKQQNIVQEAAVVDSNKQQNIVQGVAAVDSNKQNNVVQGVAAVGLQDKKEPNADESHLGLGDKELLRKKRAA